MSGWQSHLPVTKRFDRVTGLGLNEEELGKNTQLTDYLVKDLNGDPGLQFADNAFDAVVCSLSVEYLIAPVDVFSEAARVLAPRWYFYRSLLQSLVPTQNPPVFGRNCTNLNEWGWY